TTEPSLPRTLAFFERSRSPFGLAPRWQSRQCEARSGAICLSKSGGAAATDITARMAISRDMAGPGGRNCHSPLRVVAGQYLARRWRMGNNRREDHRASRNRKRGRLVEHDVNDSGTQASNPGAFAELLTSPSRAS